MPVARRTTTDCRTREGERGLDETVSLDFDAIPMFAKEELATAALDAVTRFLQRPDAKAILDAERERLRQEGSRLLEARPLKLKGAKI